MTAATEFSPGDRLGLRGPSGEWLPCEFIGPDVRTGGAVVRMVRGSNPVVSVPAPREELVFELRPIDDPAVEFLEPCKACNGRGYEAPPPLTREPSKADPVSKVRPCTACDGRRDRPYDPWKRSGQ